MRKLQQKINYQFKDTSLLNVALTHRSANKDHNERLEFLGDSILGAVIATKLFNLFHDIDEGILSRIKANLVCGTTLLSIAIKLEISKYLILGVGEAKSGGYKRDSILEDALEALIGAVFIDGGFASAQQVILKIYQHKLVDIDVYMDFKDDKTKLQEYLQKYQKSLPIYKLIATSGKDHNAIFTVMGSVVDYQISVEKSANSIKKAQHKCAKILLTKLLT